MQSSTLKIASLRKHYGNLIGTVDNKTETVQNPFNQPAPAVVAKTATKTRGAMSLSVYNRPAMLSRPRTANENILRGVKGLEPVEVDENGTPIEQPVDPRVAEMQVPEGLRMLARTGTEQCRLETMTECEKIKMKLATDGCPMSMAVLERAVMIPEDVEWLPGKREYPNAGQGLMVNPFPKPKKKKKGKKKK